MTFLLSRQDLKDEYAQYARLKKGGGLAVWQQHRWRGLQQALRDFRTNERHLRWWKVYEARFEQALDDEFADGATEKQAHKRARIRAEQALCDAFPEEVKTTRGAREALRLLTD